jgi:hypothetical protein
MDLIIPSGYYVDTSMKTNQNNNSMEFSSFYQQISNYSTSSWNHLNNNYNNSNDIHRNYQMNNHYYDNIHDNLHSNTNGSATDGLYNSSLDGGMYECMNMNENVTYFNVSCETILNYSVPLYGYITPILLLITMTANSLIVIVLSRRNMATPTNSVLMGKF